MAPRANWRGYLKLAELICPVALFSAASTSDRVAFHTLNRKTGRRVHRQFFDAETGASVAAEDQVKGYETAPGQFVTIEPEEIAAILPEGDKTIEIQSFVRSDDIDDLYLGRPYYLAPGERDFEAFALLSDGLRSRDMAAVASAVLFRRMRSLLLRPADAGLVVSMLEFDYEIRSPKEAFEPIPEVKVQGEMLDLAKHIIDVKSGKFDISGFEDRYETALAEVVRAKLDGRKIAPPKRSEPVKSGNLIDLLRSSAAMGSAPKTAKARKPAVVPAKAGKQSRRAS